MTIVTPLRFLLLMGGVELKTPGMAFLNLISFNPQDRLFISLLARETDSVLKI